MANRVDTGVEGAQAERDDIRAHIKRQRADTKRNESDPTWRAAKVQAYDELLEWLDERPARYNAKAGGVEGKRASKGAKGTKGGGR